MLREIVREKLSIFFHFGNIVHRDSNVGAIDPNETLSQSAAGCRQKSSLFGTLQCTPKNGSSSNLAASLRARAGHTAATARSMARVHLSPHSFVISAVGHKVPRGEADCFRHVSRRCLSDPSFSSSLSTSAPHSHLLPAAQVTGTLEYKLWAARSSSMTGRREQRQLLLDWWRHRVNWLSCSA